MRQHTQVTASQFDEFDCDLHIGISVVSTCVDARQASLSKEHLVNVDATIDRMVLALYVLVTVRNGTLP